MAQNTFSTRPLQQLLNSHPDALAAVICGVFLILGWLALHFSWIGLALILLPVAYVIGGYESARLGLTTLLEEKELDVDLLMIVAALGAAALGLWRREYYLIVDGAVLILIFAISGALEGYAMKRTERSIRSLMSLTPDTARVILHGQERVLPIAQLKVGDIVLVKPGELIPTDGTIASGYSTINQASITGESLPVEKTIGDEVFGGTINGNGAIALRLHKPPTSSLIQRVIQLVQQAQTEEPPSQQFLTQFERGYAKVIVFTGILLAILPPFLWQWDWETTIYRALIFLVVASPCALMAAIMPTLLSGIANGARQGILFKNGAQLENMGRVRAIAFDKTGTLTTGQPQVVQIIPASSEQGSRGEENRVLQLAAALEAYSEHPIGQAIVQAAFGRNLELPPATNVQALPGFGITGEVDGIACAVGKANAAKESSTSSSHLPPRPPAHLLSNTQKLESEGKTVVWVQAAGEVLGIIAIADTLRPTATQTIQRLKQLGVEQIIMLTGDNNSTAQSVAQQLNVDQVYAELLPEDKVSVIRRLQKQYKTVAMVGDGVNDAPALAAATVGIAMGAAGSDIALETADIVLMADRLEKLEQAIRLGRRSQVIVKQNIAFALGFIVLLLAANFAGNITLPFGVIGHEGSTVLVTLSGLRLLRN
ncbi:heavy metal translocating P-type ATPase [Microseira wollei]|uniref:Cadmium-transporting ATPase n=1 Tax=Microseira wollei NIES-4236 TaxID=2530354 RepID=A0AAV3XJH6_9CYAN|nr:heavy metal translocating P-type ATPase [Microseira wollei]GET40315.1 cadmium-transporting ATPase [Microseira wollei NIES-4236]